MAKIIIELPDDRNKLGTLKLIDDNGLVIAGPYEAYGRADSETAKQKHNPNRNPIHPYGDTPLGGYESIPVRTGEGTRFNFNAYGTNGGLVLIPKSGEALFAKENKRDGIMIHGGIPGDHGKLRATNGCVRLANQDMFFLMEAIGRIAQKTYFTAINPGIAIEVVRELITDSGYDEGDPADPIVMTIQEHNMEQERLRIEEERRRAEEERRRAEEERRRIERDAQIEARIERIERDRAERDRAERDRAERDRAERDRAERERRDRDNSNDLA